MKREEAEAIYELGKEAVVEILLKMDARITALEIRLRLNSSNSSKPPSTDSPFAQKPKTTSNAKRKAGGQKGREGKNLKMVEHPDVVIVSSAKTCSDCGASLANIQSRLVASRQVFDLPVLKIEVTEHQVHAKRVSTHLPLNF